METKEQVKQHLTNQDLLILCLIRACTHEGEHRKTTAIAEMIDLPRMVVLRDDLTQHKQGYIERLRSPLLTEAGQRMVTGRYCWEVDGKIKLFELVQRF